MIRFLVNLKKAAAIGDFITLGKDDLRHAKVLRLREGENVELLNGAGNFWRGIFTGGFENGGVRIEALGSAPKEIPEIVLAVGLTQGGTFETIVRQAVELGVGAVMPLKSDHGAVGIDDKRAASKRERWERIVDEACKQSGNYWRTHILPLQTPEEFLKEISNAHPPAPSLGEGDNNRGPAAPLPRNLEVRKPAVDVLHLVAALNEETAGWKEINFSGAKKVVVWIGPEGDFSKEEYLLLKNAGAKFVSLGKTVLRVETACVAAVAGVKALL
jgi:16S rRNA (uracil1498-N3)-methyltransferase